MIIAGSRSIPDPRLVEQAMEESGFQVGRVLTRDAVGADALGRAWADARRIPVTTLPAQWHWKGRGAAPSRDAEMLKQADALVAVWDGKSRNTQRLIEQARAAGLRVHVLTIGSDGKALDCSPS